MAGARPRYRSASAVHRPAAATAQAPAVSEAPPAPQAVSVMTARTTACGTRPPVNRPPGPPTWSSSGTFVAQVSNACGQRGRKAQPLGSLRRSGGEPAMPVSSRFGPASVGKEPSRPRL
jgi:hypothetical protein